MAGLMEHVDVDLIVDTLIPTSCGARVIAPLRNLVAFVSRHDHPMPRADDEARPLGFRRRAA
jgi:hypothetical protein